MIAELIAAGTLITIVFGIVTFIINSRVGNLKSQVEEMGKTIETLTTRVVIVESERDTAKKDLEHCKDSRIEVLEENRGMRSIMARCTNCRAAHLPIAHHPV